MLNKDSSERIDNWTYDSFLRRITGKSEKKIEYKNTKKLSSCPSNLWPKVRDGWRLLIESTNAAKA